MATVTMPCTDQEVPHSIDNEDGTRREVTQETTAQQLDKALPDASLHECRVAMVPLKDIYVESDPHDEDLVTALADSICHIGLQNPICVVKNDLPEHDTPYRIVSGRQRYQAYQSLGREYIPCHILTYDEEEFADEKKQLAQYEENLLRKHLTLIETCTLLGKAKEAYLIMYPETGPGKASPKNPETGRFPYTGVASQRLGKSKSTIEKYLQIYDALIAPRRLEALQAVEHPILQRVEDLSALAKSQDDIPTLVEILCKYTDKNTGKFCSLHDAQQQLQRKKEVDALRKARGVTQTQPTQRAHTTRSQATDKPAPAPGDSGSDTDNLEARDGETQQSEQGLSLDAVLAAFTQCLQQHIDKYVDGGEDLHTFRAEIVPEHNSLWVVVTSNMSQPPDVTDLPAGCPGWGLHSASAAICNSCVYKARCEDAQTVVVGKAD